MIERGKETLDLIHLVEDILFEMKRIDCSKYEKLRVIPWERFNNLISHNGLQSEINYIFSQNQIVDKNSGRQISQ